PRTSPVQQALLPAGLVGPPLSRRASAEGLAVPDHERFAIACLEDVAVAKLGSITSIGLNQLPLSREIPAAAIAIVAPREASVFEATLAARLVGACSRPDPYVTVLLVGCR